MRFRTSNGACISASLTPIGRSQWATCQKPTSNSEAMIADARVARDRDILGRALHDRGLVAYERHQCQQAITLLQEAAPAPTSASA